MSKKSKRKSGSKSQEKKNQTPTPIPTEVGNLCVGHLVATDRLISVTCAICGRHNYKHPTHVAWGRFWGMVNEGVFGHDFDVMDGETLLPLDTVFGAIAHMEVADIAQAMTCSKCNHVGAKWTVAPYRDVYDGSFDGEADNYIFSGEGGRQGTEILKF